MKLQFGYRLFFFIALFFTMMHVAALVIATIPGGKIVFFGIIYLVDDLPLDHGAHHRRLTC